MSKAIFKFNNGNGALLCSGCSAIIKVGFEFTENEKQAMFGKAKLEAQYCKICQNKKEMKLQDQITSGLTRAILNNQTQKRDLLRVVIGEMNRVGKELTDEQVIKILKKMVENAKLCGNLDEIPILNEYIPETMDYNAIKDVISEIIFIDSYTQKDMSKIMSNAKIQLGNSFDGKIVSQIIKEIFN